MRLITLVLAVGLLSSCSASERASVNGGTGLETVDLPAPATGENGSLEQVLAARRSVRDFARGTLDMGAVSQLLWAAQGITGPGGRRTAPSAGGLSPLEVYLATPAGLYHYLPLSHRLEVISGDDLSAELAAAALEQESVADAAAVFVIAAVYERTEEKYEDRAERYVKLEAGHAAQNLLLQATALGLAAVPIGAFRDAEVQKVLDLPADHEPLYLIPVGHPPQ